MEDIYKVGEKTMKDYKITVHNQEETFSMAQTFSKFLREGDTIALEGDLGAGKTTFTKGLAKGLGINKNISSPTFTIIKEYKGIFPLYHMDVYRLKDSMEDLGFDEYFHGDGITVIEWAHIIQDQLPEQFLTIEIKFVDLTTRQFLFKPVGIRYEQLCEEFFHEYFSN